MHGMSFLDVAARDICCIVFSWCYIRYYRMFQISEKIVIPTRERKDLECCKKYLYLLRWEFTSLRIRHGWAIILPYILDVAKRNFNVAHYVSLRCNGPSNSRALAARYEIYDGRQCRGHLFITFCYFCSYRKWKGASACAGGSEKLLSLIGSEAHLLAW